MFRAMNALHFLKNCNVRQEEVETFEKYLMCKKERNEKNAKSKSIRYANANAARSSATQSSADISAEPKKRMYNTFTETYAEGILEYKMSLIIVVQCRL
jgi:3-methyladenine DNA glycosylase Tag